jgi:O-antigen ligase
MSSFWMVFAALALSLTWLLPNHSFPWVGFHGDAWAALMLLVVGVFVLWRNKLAVGWHWMPVLVAGSVAIPLLQYVSGMTAFFGVAWINAAYLLGFALALLVGAAWEKVAPHQCADYLFVAIGVASVCSVGLQLYQLLGLAPIGPWTLNSVGTRYSANLAQPNQLASLLLLGLLGCGWGHARKFLNPYFAVSLAAFLLLGVALTESRTGWLNVTLLVVAVFFWRRLAPSHSYLKVVAGLTVFFVACVWLAPAINDFTGSGESIRRLSVSNDARWTAWKMFLRAAANRPLLGFGWGQLGQAQFLMLDEHTPLGANFLQAHNLILDLVLWNGIPLGLAIGGFLAWWFWTVARRLNNFAQWLLMSFVIVLGTHAMLEFPLQYAYFLLPMGMVAGCLNVTLELGLVLRTKRWLTGVVLVLAIAALTITIRDYFRAETSLYGLRFEQKKLKTSIPPTPPDVLVLTQWHDYILFARIEPRRNMSSTEFVWMRALVSTLPSAYGMYRFAAMLALNGQPQEAQKWLLRICLVTPPEQSEAIQAEWANQSRTYGEIAAIPWPNIAK